MPGGLSSLSLCLQLRSWSLSPGMEPWVGSLLRGQFVSLYHPLPLPTTHSLSRKEIKSKKPKTKQNNKNKSPCLNYQKQGKDRAWIESLSLAKKPQNKIKSPFHILERYLRLWNEHLNMSISLGIFNYIFNVTHSVRRKGKGTIS